MHVFDAGADEGHCGEASGFSGSDEEGGFSGEVADFAFEEFDAEGWDGDLGPAEAGFFAGFTSGSECDVEHAGQRWVGGFVDVCECLEGSRDLSGDLVVALD